jgi:hypothetical protein
MAEMDFPLNPVVGQRYENSTGTVYQWDGSAWVVGFYDSSTETFAVLGDLLDQIRTLLQDTDNFGGTFRYSTESIVANINMGLLEMYRIRPDIFLATSFVVPQYESANLAALWTLEQQWIPPMIYYAVGMTQIRDDEGTQDTRAGAFLQKFNSMLTGAVVGAPQ